MAASEILLATVGKVWGFVKGPIGRLYTKHKSKKRAFKGENIFDQGDYYQLVNREIQRLSIARDLPVELQSEQCRKWLVKAENFKLFAKVFLARWAQRTDIAGNAEEQLAIDYEQCTDETRKLASGRVELAINFVYGQLTATDDGVQSLQLACNQLIAGEIFVSRQAVPPIPPSEDEIPLLKAMAETILSSAEHTWRIPQYVAPLSLEMHIPENVDEVFSTNISKLVAAMQSGENIVIYGSGGIGKTTLLLGMCRTCLNKGGRVPIYIDVAAWCKKQIGLLEYVTTLPAAVSNGVNQARLAKFAEAGKLVIMLNGWNETSPRFKLDCIRDLTDLMTMAGSLNIVVVSRSNIDVPNIDYSKHIEVRGLSWEGQRAIVEEGLDNEQSESVLELLGRNNHLRHSARSPLILNGLISQFNKGITDGHGSEYDILRSTVDAFEGDEQRSLILSSEPIDNNHQVYLEEIACFLTNNQTVNCSREEALTALSLASKQLVVKGQISVPANLLSVLNILSSHHLLHIDNDIVRFAHQRYQEFFAARRLLSVCLATTQSLASIIEFLNQTAWDDAVDLVISKLVSAESFAKARIKLIRAGVDLDIGLACDLIGACSFGKSDDEELHDYIVERVNLLAGSNVDEVRYLGVAYQIASRLPVFADQLWNLLEDDSQQNRLRLYRLNATEISILQLGENAGVRISKWPTDRCVEFVTETAKNPDNYDYLVKLAKEDPDQNIRSAAISVFPWEYPASDVPIKVLLNAPLDVLTNYEAISCVKYYSEMGDDVKEILQRLKSFSANKIPFRSQVELALAFPHEFGLLYQEAILQRLEDHDHYMHHSELLKIAQTYFPECVFELAKEMAFKKKPSSPQDQVLRYQPFPPLWVATCLQNSSKNLKNEIFQGLLCLLSDEQDASHLDEKIFGPLASSDQIKECLNLLVQHNGDVCRKVSDEARDRIRKIEHILASAEGVELIGVVKKFGEEASYDEASLMLKFLNLRIESEGPGEVIKKWRPSTGDVSELISILSEKEETVLDSQDLVRIYLCSIASHVDPLKFMPFIVESCQQHLVKWDNYRDRMANWSKEQKGSRPINPMYTNSLKAAVSRCGKDALPDLLSMLNHAGASDLIIGSMVRILNEPWIRKKESHMSGISSAIQEGKERRKQGLVNRQPEIALQPLTDQVAKELGKKLTKKISEYHEQRKHNKQFDPRVAEHPVGHLAVLLAGISSPEIIEPINLALVSGLMNVYHSANAIEGLIRQGLILDDKKMITHLEELFENSNDKDWYNDHERYEMTCIVRLLLSVEQIDQLSKPVDYYLDRWKKFSSINDIIQGVGSINSEAAWEILASLESEIIGVGRLSNEYAGAIINVLNKNNITYFFEKIVDRTFFEYCSDRWELKRIAKKLIGLLKENPRLVEDFTTLCGDVRSPFADVLVVNVLPEIEGTDYLFHKYLIDAVDDGRAVNANMPAFHAITSLFNLNIPAGSNSYEIIQRASNDIKRKIFLRAKGSGEIANGCKWLLAHIELERREFGRPKDEIRHPEPKDNTRWDDIFINDVAH